jgi:ATP-dependent helicase HrpB
MDPLPIDDRIPEIISAVRDRKRLVIVAPPGSGKTTRVAPALAEIGRTILLQPRRVAARALTRRIAQERGWTVGREIGWQIRFERKFSKDTRLLVATEGILTARLQSDPLLSDFSVVILDEFHERSIHADLALALVRHAAEARGDLAIVVMSATLDAGRVAAFLGGAPVMAIDSRTHPVAVEYRPGQAISAVVPELLARTQGHILCFLPGQREIQRTIDELAPIARGVAALLPLHGSLDIDAQERALAPSDQRKIIVATNVAETSLTVDGVVAVIDSGEHKIVRFDPDTGIDRLESERISLDSADQRAGRAGRTRPGVAVRLWDARDILEPHREPEIARVELSSTLLDLIAWGGDPYRFEWFEAPVAERIDAAMGLLELLGAVVREGDSSDARALPAAKGARFRLTELGDALRSIPLHPRLGRVLIEAGGGMRAALICAAISDGLRLPRGAASHSTDSDAFTLEEQARRRPHLRELTREVSEMSRRVSRRQPASDDESILRSILAGYPDRVARRRDTASPRMQLASGTGAVLARESGVRSEMLVAIDVAAGDRGPGSEAIVRAASRIEKEWLEPTRIEIVHQLESSTVRATRRVWYFDLLLDEQSVPPDPDQAAWLLRKALAERLRTGEGVDEMTAQILHRVAFARLTIDWDSVVERAASSSRSLDDIRLLDALDHASRRDLDARAPATLLLPSGRQTALRYESDGSVTASAKLQELFGLASSPRVGADRAAVTFELLAPNGRPVQVTRDLRSFWNTTYAEVRKELRGRYPRHPWPEDPWNATPTAKTKRRKK